MDPARSDRRPFVLDTSLFVNPDSRRFFGSTVSEALTMLVLRCRDLGVPCYMPPSVYRELLGFVDRKALSPVNPLGFLVQKAPSMTVAVPASLLGTWIADGRHRIDRGLRLAEKAVRAAVKGESEDVALRRLRKEYRAALREGTLDSVEDLELVLLAAEIDGIVLSADEGLRSFGEKLGVCIMDPDQAAAYLDTETREGNHP